MRLLIQTMLRVDVNSLSPLLLRKIKRGELIILTRNDEDLCAVIPMDILNLLEGLQLESLEEEDESIVDDIKSMIRSIS